MKYKYLLKKINILLYLCPLLLLLINLPFIINNNKIIFPIKNSEFMPIYFTDESNKGNSEIINFKLTKNKMEYTFILREGFHDPYTGFGIYCKSSKGLDISKYQNIIIRLKAKNSIKLRCELKFYEKNVTKFEDAVSYRYFVKEIIASDDFKTYTHKMNDFKTPGWWYKYINIPQDAGIITKKIKKKFYGINFISDETLKINIEDNIAIEYIEFKKNIIPTLLISIILIIIIYSYIIIYSWLKQKKAIIIYHKKLEIKKSKDINEQKIFNYIYDNYNNPDISISSIYKATGIYIKKISKIIKNKTGGLSFKQYLNHVRLNEAKKLLMETDRNITEIAFYIGYNNSSHFARIFRQYFKISPTEFRNKKQ